MKQAGLDHEATLRADVAFLKSQTQGETKANSVRAAISAYLDSVPTQDRHVLDIRAANGVPFRVVFEMGMVEFFDRRYNKGFTPDGQFVSRYYLDSLFGTRFTYVFDLHGGVPDWTIDADTMEIVHSWLRNVATTLRRLG